MSCELWAVSDQGQVRAPLITGSHGLFPPPGSAGGAAESMNLASWSLSSGSILTNAMPLPNCGSQVTTFADQYLNPRVLASLFDHGLTSVEPGPAKWSLIPRANKATCRFGPLP
jgi:hypothetical protein